MRHLALVTDLLTGGPTPLPVDMQDGSCATCSGDRFDALHTLGSSSRMRETSSSLPSHSNASWPSTKILITADMAGSQTGTHRVATRTHARVSWSDSAKREGLPGRLPSRLVALPCRDRSAPDRQMVVLEREDWQAWLDLSKPEMELLQPLTAGALRVEQVR
jgi:hypothetical protein